jgi:hypothetical protein
MGRGLNFIQTTKNFSDIDIEKIDQLIATSPLHLEPKSFEKEHGIYIHLPYLKKYFPESKLIPIIIKLQTPENRLDSLIKNLEKHISANTLIIASVDFTHYEAEKIALKNDNRTIAWLENLKNTNMAKMNIEQIRQLAQSSDKTFENSVAFDSPESLYLLIKLLNPYHATNFTFFKRTSTLSLTRLTNPLDNTSHIFGEFHATSSD